ncbi:EAL domain-containing protein [Sporosarcina oncorhynchi]|uniref:EAL domain-containing protein n=1 Tax=Sporosarcina oncorhynchi TaxID=3056444 RepID=A0ABZ0L6B6_9BACL|nr:EAL domain-containing protein [Sporosarcina sp. T2O-4]WOV87478.1 EAL domain-containing protein [Sporosarcina sp. T2O-4]
MVFSKLNTPALLTLMDQTFSLSISDAEGKLIFINHNFCKLTGYSEKELIGKSYSFLNPSYDPYQFIQEMQTSFSEKSLWQKKIKGIHKNGSFYWVIATIIPVRDDNEKIIQYFSVDVDITSRERTSEKYNKTLHNLRNIENALDYSSVVAITDEKGIITYVNEKFCTLSQYTNEELIGKTHRIVNSDYHPKSFFKEMWKTILNGKIWEGDVRNRAKDGSIYWVKTTIVPFFDGQGKPKHFISIRHDITDRKKAEEDLEIALQNDFRQTVKNLHNAIFKYGLTDEGSIEFSLFEGKISEQLGVSTQMLNNREYAKAFSTEELRIFSDYLHAGLSGEQVQFEMTYKNLSLLVNLSPIVNGKDIKEVVGTAIDITERIEAEKVIEHMAYFDFLTGLPNRRNLQDSIQLRISDGSKPFSVFFLDLDRFKHVNDSLGHQVGDQLLIAVGARLRCCTTKDDLVARLSGDEFIVVVPSTDTQRLTALATTIVEELSEPFKIETHDVFITPSIGIVLYPEDGNDYNTLMRNADSAMYMTKEEGNHRFRFFTSDLQVKLLEKSFLEMELRQALDNKQFSLHYQPQIDLATGLIKGLEALARWEHPERGFIAPNRFIPIAEENGFILQLGAWVLRQACRQAKAWQDKGFLPLRISVNVSMRQFIQPAFVEDVKKILAETGLDPAYLNLEITESMMSDVQQCQPKLIELQQAGISVSIDDFGTGYSSLLYLSKFPISHLKIDQAFIGELSKENSMIVKAIIDLAKNLNLNVIAEGVETSEQENFLKELKCDEVQGYYYAKPMPWNEVEKFLNRT